MKSPYPVNRKKGARACPLKPRRFSPARKIRSTSFSSSKKKGDEIIRGNAKSQDTLASESSGSQESQDSSAYRPEERLLIILNPLPHKSGDTNLFLAPLNSKGGRGD
jgi:hypothetical protein